METPKRKRAEIPDSLLNGKKGQKRRKNTPETTETTPNDPLVIIKVVEQMAKNLNPTQPKKRVSPDWLAPYRHHGMFKPGQSGNPNGRPPGKSKKRIADVYKQMADVVEPTTGLKYAELVALAVFHNAIVDKNVFAAREIREAIDGKSMDQVPLEVAEGMANSAQQKLLQSLVNAQRIVRENAKNDANDNSNGNGDRHLLSDGEFIDGEVTAA